LAEIILIAALVLAALALVIGLYRLLAGPCTVTRAVALDVLTLITIPLLVAVAVISGRAIYVDVALVYAILSFLGVLALARYLEKGI
jgi:multicomponent Na+:H+ antiporter subunit F